MSSQYVKWLDNLIFGGSNLLVYVQLSEDLGSIEQMLIVKDPAIEMVVSPTLVNLRLGSV
jgi:hypothetical protein